MPFKSQAQRRKFAQLLVEGKISKLAERIYDGVGCVGCALSQPYQHSQLRVGPDRSQALFDHFILGSSLERDDPTDCFVDSLLARTAPGYLDGLRNEPTNPWFETRWSRNEVHRL
jgi:hypothetical protein